MSDPRPLAVVTGASSGIGRALADVLAREGWDLLLVARRQDRLEAAAAEVARRGASAQVLALDLQRPEAAEAVRARAREIGPCHLLVNNAGVGVVGPFTEQELPQVEGILSLDIAALTRLMHLFLADMLAARRGAVMNVASTAGFQPVPRFACYAAAKAYVVSLSCAVDEELRESGVRVMAVCPGPTRTEFNQVAGISTTAFASTYMSAEAVAEAAVAGMRAGKTLVVPGAMNEVSVLATKFLPRAAVMKIAGWIYKKSDARGAPPT